MGNARWRYRWPERPWPPDPMPLPDDPHPERPGTGRRDLPGWICANCRAYYESDDHPAERVCPICGHDEILV